MKTENWNGHEIRFIEAKGEWWAVASDIASAMGFKDAHTAIRKMKAKYKGRYKVPTLGGEQEMTILNEKGIYRMIMRSNRPEAEEFQDFVYDVLSTLREADGLAGFEIFRQLDKEHQKAEMKKLRDGLKQPVRVDFIKANTITNKAVSNKHGLPKMVKKGDMTPEMLKEREPILEDTVKLMCMKDEFGLDISVSDAVYKKYSA